MRIQSKQENPMRSKLPLRRIYPTEGYLLSYPCLLYFRQFTLFSSDWVNKTKAMFQDTLTIWNCYAIFIVAIGQMIKQFNAKSSSAGFRQQPEWNVSPKNPVWTQILTCLSNVPINHSIYYEICLEVWQCACKNIIRLYISPK